MSDTFDNSHNPTTFTRRGSNLCGSRAFSFKEFLNEVLQECGVLHSELDNPEDYCESYLHDIREFLRNDRKRKNGDELPGQQNREQIFDCLKTFNSGGDSDKRRTLENCSGSVKNYSGSVNGAIEVDKAANTFKNLSCKANDGGLVAVRVSVDEDQDISNADLSTAGVELPPQRMSPWNVLAWLMLREPHENLIDHVEKCAAIAGRLLFVSPQRRVVFSALTNYDEIMFVAAYHMVVKGVKVTKFRHTLDINIRGLRSSCSNKWVEELSQFLGAKAPLLGHCSVISDMYGARMTEALGSGSTGAVVRLLPLSSETSASSASSSWPVLKVSRDHHALRNEVRTIAAIRTHLAASDETHHLLRRLPDCRAVDNLPEAVELSEVFEPVAEVTPDTVLSVWELLQEIHAARYVHRDLRVPNIVKINRASDDSEACCCYGLIDFGSACSVTSAADTSTAPDLVIPPGGLATASPRVVDSFYRNQALGRPLGLYECTRNDEVFSLIYLTMQQHPYCRRACFWFPPSCEQARVKVDNAIFDIEEQVSGDLHGRLGELLDLLITKEDTEVDRDKVLRECLKIIKESWDKC